MISGIHGFVCWGSGPVGDGKCRGAGEEGRRSRRSRSATKPRPSRGGESGDCDDRLPYGEKKSRDGRLLVSVAKLSGGGEDGVALVRRSARRRLGAAARAVAASAAAATAARGWPAVLVAALPMPGAPPRSLACAACPCHGCDNSAHQRRRPVRAAGGRHARGRRASRLALTTRATASGRGGGATARCVCGGSANGGLWPSRPQRRLQQQGRRGGAWNRTEVSVARAL